MNPAATPPGSPAPSTTPTPGATKRPRMAVALSDVTNLLPDVRTPTKPRRTGERRRPQKQQPSDAAASTCSSFASVTPGPKRSSAASVTPAPAGFSASPVTPAPKRASVASVTPAPKRTPAASVTPAPKRTSAVEDLDDMYPISAVYARRGATEAEGTRRRTRRAAPTATDKGKGKEPAVAAAAAAAAGAASCPPLGKSTGDRNMESSVAQDTRLISSSSPCAKKKRPLSSTPKLPEDFVEKQRAYFKAIDDFELVEEEVSESDLD